MHLVFLLIDLESFIRYANLALIWSPVKRGLLSNSRVGRVSGYIHDHSLTANYPYKSISYDRQEIKWQVSA